MFVSERIKCGECITFQIGKRGLEKPTETTGPCGFHDRPVITTGKVKQSLIVSAQDLCIYWWKTDEFYSDAREEEVAHKLNEHPEFLAERVEPRDLYLKRIDPSLLDKIIRRVYLPFLVCNRCLLYSDPGERGERGGRCNLFDSVNTSLRNLEQAVFYRERNCKFGFREGYDFSSLDARKITRIANRHRTSPSLFTDHVSENDVNTSYLFPDW